MHEQLNQFQPRLDELRIRWLNIISHHDTHEVGSRYTSQQRREAGKTIRHQVPLILSNTIDSVQSGLADVMLPIHDNGYNEELSSIVEQEFREVWVNTLFEQLQDCWGDTFKSKLADLHKYKPLLTTDQIFIIISKIYRGEDIISLVHAESRLVYPPILNSVISLAESLPQDWRPIISEGGILRAIPTAAAELIAKHYICQPSYSWSGTAAVADFLAGVNIDLAPDGKFVRDMQVTDVNFSEELRNLGLEKVLIHCMGTASAQAAVATLVCNYYLQNIHRAERIALLKTNKSVEKGMNEIISEFRAIAIPEV